MSVAANSDDVRVRKFSPNSDAQKEFMLSTRRQLLYSGSFGAGKSRAGCEKGYMLNCKYAGNRGLIVRKSNVDVKTSTIQQSLLEDVIPDSHIVGHNRGDQVIVHRTGVQDPSGEPVYSEIHYYGLTSGENRSSDDLPRKIGSTEYGWIFVDEGTEVTQGDWNQLLGRLRYNSHEQNGYVYKIPVQQVFTATNPDSPQHWMHDHFGLGGNSHLDREYWKANLEDNRANLPDEYIADLKASLSGMYKERYIEGKWVGAEGMVYKEFEPDRNLPHPSELVNRWGWSHHGRDEYEDGEVTHWVTPPQDWRLYRAIDFGYRNPFVCQWWARGPDDQLVLFREIYETEETVSDLAPRIESFTPDGFSVEQTIVDHDAEDAAELQKQGIDTTPAQKEVSPGIQSVKERIKPDDRGRPDLYIMQGARCHKTANRLALDDDLPTKTIDEVYGYQWKEDEDEPVKENDHGMDGTRYIVYTLDDGPTMDEDDMSEIAELVNEGW